MVELKKRNRTEYSKEYYLKNKEAKQDYYKAHRDSNKESRAVVIREWQQNNPEYTLFNAARTRAKARNLEFNIEREDVVIPTHCPIMGIEITSIKGEGRVKSNPSLDRIDPTKGYVKGNVQVICDLANRMKQNATLEELLMFAKGVVKLHG